MTTQDPVTNHTTSHRSNGVTTMLNGITYKEDLEDKNECTEENEDKSLYPPSQLFTCQKCQINFTTLKQLQDHIRKYETEQSYINTVAINDSDESIDDHQCEEGSTQFNDHHSLDKRYQCQYCNKKLASTESLRRHVRTHTGERPYQCQYCEKDFVTNGNLLRHLRIHYGERPYQCRHCEKTFTQSFDLKRHIACVHTGNKHQCSYCNKTFESSISLNIHTRIHDDERPYLYQSWFSMATDHHTKDHTTGDTTSYRSDGTMATMLNGNTYKGNLGDKNEENEEETLSPSSDNETSLQYTTVPVPKELTVKPSSIPDAGLGVFAVQSIPKGVRFGPYKGKKLYEEDLNEGMDTNYMWEVQQFGELYFIDGQIEKESNWMRYINCARNDEEQNLVAIQYKGDIYYHSIKPVYPESELLVWYGDQYAKDLGISIDEQGHDSQVFICKNCGRSFVTQSHFDAHFRHSKSCSETFPQIFTCQKCQISFTRLHQLQDHIRKHEDRQSNVNSVVNIEDDTDESLEDLPIFIQGNDHHSDNRVDKRYQCRYCNKRFATLGYFRKHMCRTVARPFQCQYCEKDFAKNENLRVHMRVHTGERPYKCQHCEKDFTCSGNLLRHIRIHTGERPYQCQYCGKRFIQNTMLQKHIASHHTCDKKLRPYPCQYCDMRSASSRGLKCHIRRAHMGDKQSL